MFWNRPPAVRPEYLEEAAGNYITGVCDRRNSVL